MIPFASLQRLPLRMRKIDVIIMKRSKTTLKCFRMKRIRKKLHKNFKKDLPSNSCNFGFRENFGISVCNVLKYHQSNMSKGSKVQIRTIDLCS
jgi:hypothetical protein